MARRCQFTDIRAKNEGNHKGCPYKCNAGTYNSDITDVGFL